MNEPSHRLLSLLASAALVAGCATDGDDRAERRGEKTQRTDLQSLLDRVRAAGAPGVVAVVRNDSGRWRGATGKAGLKPARPMRPRDRLRVASLTKTFVATVVLQLVDEGRLALEDTVEQRFPGLLREGRRITVRQLLNHTSGLASANDADILEVERLYREKILGGEIRFDISVRQAVAFVNAVPLRFAPGADWDYSNTGYEVLMLVVERVTGEPLAEALESRIIRPLRLTATSFEPQPLEAEEGLAHGYAIAGSDWLQANWAPLDMTAASNFAARWASGSLVSNGDDIVTFYASLLGGKLLPRDLLDEMLDTVPTTNRRERYGLGISREGRVECGWAWGHGGVSAGYTTWALANKDGSHVVFLGANAYAPTLFEKTFREAAYALYCRS